MVQLFLCELDFVRLRNSIERNPLIKFDLVRFIVPDLLRQCAYFGDQFGDYSNYTQYCFTVLTPTLILTGGSTLLPGLGERLHKEIATLVNPRDPGRVRVISPDDRKHAVWSGSAVLAGLSTFPQMCISMQEYDEMGPEIVHRKCF